MAADEVRHGLCNTNLLGEAPEGGAVENSLSLQNLSSSTESAEANIKASDSGHCLDSSGKSMEWGSKREGVLAKTQFRAVLE